MDSAQILKALEKEKELLEEFLSLSQQQLLLLGDENIEAVEMLLDERMNLMTELSAIEATLGTWISQIRNNLLISVESQLEMRSLNDEIVSLANRVVEIDEQTRLRLDLFKEKTMAELREIHTGARALQKYGASFGAPSELYIEG